MYTWHKTNPHTSANKEMNSLSLEEPEQNLTAHACEEGVSYSDSQLSYLPASFSPPDHTSAGDGSNQR